MDDDGNNRGSSDERSDESTVTCVTHPSARLDIEPSPIGSTIGRYVVLDEIGEGGMGRVLRAYDPKLQREVALKRVRSDTLDETTAARLVVEARAMAKLSHPNVVPVYDVDEVGPGDVVIAMEFVAGQTLKHWLRAGERDWKEILGAYAEAGRGLVAAHEVGLLHRDFKPANVLVSERGAVKVTDFGLAKVATDSSSSPPGGTPSGSMPAQALSVTLTGAGSVMGTPRYMAPEQHAGDALTPAADQYAFCVALWEALCGEPPFTDKQIPWGKTNGPPAWPEPTVPTPIAQAIARGLSPHPDDRWSSMAELLEALSYESPRLGRRLAVGAVGASAVVLLLWASQRGDEITPCTGAEAQLAGIWDGDRQDEVRAAFEAIDRPYATRTGERIARLLDEYAAAWTAMHTDVCQATTVRGEQSSEVMDLRMGCLHRAAVVLRATTEQLANIDAETAANAQSLIAELRPLSRCEDVDALRQATAPPLPEQVEAVDRVRVLVAEAQAALAAGRYDPARDAIDAAVTAASDVDYGPMQAEVALVRGKILDALGDYAAAETSLQSAMELASRWQLWEEQAEAVTLLMDVVGGSTAAHGRGAPARSPGARTRGRRSARRGGGLERDRFGAQSPGQVRRGGSRGAARPRGAPRVQRFARRRRQVAEQSRARPARPGQDRGSGGRASPGLGAAGGAPRFRAPERGQLAQQPREHPRLPGQVHRGRGRVPPGSGGAREVARAEPSLRGVDPQQPRQRARGSGPARGSRGHAPPGHGRSDRGTGTRSIPRSRTLATTSRVSYRDWDDSRKPRLCIGAPWPRG